MITDTARHALEQSVMNALKGALPNPHGAASEVCEIETLSGVPAQRMVALTVSSYLFRIVTLLHFSLDDGLKQYLATISHGDVTTMSESDFLDVLCECGNIFCGAFNRDLARQFPHLGMSTPNVLEHRSLEYLDELKGNFTRHFQVDIDAGLSLHASLCVCAYAPFDFDIEQAQEEACSGELEMF